jgi:Zn-finger nucleic acid-binding protein
MTCPKCEGEMAAHRYAGVTAQRCDSCGGIFLAKSDLGGLVEAENDWHDHQSANTAALPRITDFSSPPPPRPRSRAFIEALFNA